MAEEKKGTDEMSDAKAFERITFLLVGLLLLGALATALFSFIDNLLSGAPEGLWGRVVDYFLAYIWPIWKLVAVIVSILAVFGIAHNLKKLNAISLEENAIYNPVSGTVTGEQEVDTDSKKRQWEKVKGYAASDNPSDWRLAIIEADVILEDVLRERGYEGESVGEILKSMTKDELLTLEDAWEAHKVRNSIAHTGTDFQLNERETGRIILLFENVLKEFGVI